MDYTNYTQELDWLEFTHFVVSNMDGKVFASAKARDGTAKNFIFSPDGSWVKHQINGHFEQLPPFHAEDVRKRAESFYGKVRTFRIPTLDYVN